MPANVLQGTAWIQYVKSFRQEVMSAAKAQQICQTLAQNALDQSRKTDAQHIKNLKISWYCIEIIRSLN